jgi:hypothetical protein
MIGRDPIGRLKYYSSAVGGTRYLGWQGENPTPQSLRRGRAFSMRNK